MKSFAFYFFLFRFLFTILYSCPNGYVIDFPASSFLSLLSRFASLRLPSSLFPPALFLTLTSFSFPISFFPLILPLSSFFLPPPSFFTPFSCFLRPSSFLLPPHSSLFPYLYALLNHSFVPLPYSSFLIHPSSFLHLLPSSPRFPQLCRSGSPSPKIQTQKSQNRRSKLTYRMSCAAFASNYSAVTVHTLAANKY